MLHFLEQQSDEFKPLLGLENIYRNNCENNDKENKDEEITNNTELKTQDNTTTENFKEDTLNKSQLIEDKEKEKEEEIANYRKYDNHLVDPYSNFNNFTKKYEVKINPKKDSGTYTLF